MVNVSGETDERDFDQAGCRHRAIGKLRIVNIPVPAFDANDEWFD